MYGSLVHGRKTTSVVSSLSGTTRGGIVIPAFAWCILLGSLCLGWGLFVLAVSVVDGWIVAPLPLLYLAVSAESLLSGAHVHRTRMRNERLLTYRVQELLALFVLVLLVQTLARVVEGGFAGARAFLDAFLVSPVALLDRTSIIWGLLLLVAWYATSQPQSVWYGLEPQLGEIGPEPGSSAYDDWLHSPARHFDHRHHFLRLLRLYVGSLLVVAATAGIDWNGQPFSTLANSVVATSFVYAINGVVLVTLAHSLLRTTRWRVERIRGLTNPAAAWARLNGGIVTSLLVIAVLVPAGALLWITNLALTALFGLLSALLGLLTIPVPSAMRDRLVQPQRPLLPPVVPPQQDRSTARPPLFTPPPWLFSVIVAALLITIALALLWYHRAELRKIPRLVGAVARIIVGNARRAVWSVLRFFSRAGRWIPAATLRLRRMSPAAAPSPHGTQKGTTYSTDREAVRRLFRDLVREGARAGHVRAAGETAREYAVRLLTFVPETAAELRAVARAFEIASYSHLPLDADEPSGSHRRIDAIRHALRALGKRADPEGKDVTS